MASSDQPARVGSREALAERTTTQLPTDQPPDEGARIMLGFLPDEWAIIIDALRSSGAEAGGHRIEALKAEARDRAFRYELAESTLMSEREKWLRAGRLAMEGDLRALRRIIERTENPVQIHGSGVSDPDRTEGGARG